MAIPKKKLQENTTRTVDAQLLDYKNRENVERFITHLKSAKPPLYGIVLMTPRPTPINLLDEKKKWHEHFDICFLTPLQFLTHLTHRGAEMTK